MKQKILIFLICGMVILGLTGCDSNKKEISDNSNIPGKNKGDIVKNYQLEEINIDCNLENITFINDYSLIANKKIYLYSDKKYSDTDSNCKVARDGSNYNYIGKVYWSNVLKPEVFTTNGNDIYYFNSSGEIEKESDSKKYSTILNQYKSNDFYYYDNGFYVTDNEIKYYNVENFTMMSVPENEKVLYVTSYISGNGQYVITDKNAYTFGVDENDKCHEYEDVKCTYLLVKTNLFESILKDFKDNISFFDGNYLATKDNKIYKVRYDTK